MNNSTKRRKRKSLNEKNLEKIFQRIMKSFQNKENLRKYVKSETSFIRERKIPLEVMLKLLFARACYSLTMYLMLNFSNTKQGVTKQAFSKARKQIKAEIFEDMNEELVNTYYQEYKIKKYHDKYILLAIDGTTIEIPNTKELREEYGHSKGQIGAKEIARASASCIYDPLNELIITSTIEKNNTSERQMAKEMIMEIKARKLFDDEMLYIMDRGYFSKEMLSFFIYHNQNFLFRIQKGNLKRYYEVMEKEDEWLEVSLSEMASFIKDQELKRYVKEEKRTIKLRFTKVVLSTGEVEYLLSNLEDIDYCQMKELYFKRWGIEKNYNFLKNRLKIENFSGKHKVTIEQDFYSGILNANIQYLIKKVVGKKDTKKNEYQPSMNIVSGLYKEYISLNILCSLSKLKRPFRKLLLQAKKTFIMKTPSERSSPRRPNDKVRANRYFNNIRPN